MLITDTFRYIKKSVPEKEKHQLHSRHGPLLLTKFMDATVTRSFPRISILHPCSPGQDFWILCFPRGKKKQLVSFHVCYMFAQVYACTHENVYAQAETTYQQYLSLSLSLLIFTLCFETRSLTKPGTHLFGWLGWLSNEWQICLSVPSWCWHYKSLTPWQPLHEC